MPQQTCIKMQTCSNSAKQSQTKIKPTITANKSKHVYMFFFRFILRLYAQVASFKHNHKYKPCLNSSHPLILSASLTTKISVHKSTKNTMLRHV